MLLAGAAGPAQAAVLQTFADAAEKIHHFRNGKSCKAWLVAKVRNRLLQNAGGPAAEAGPPVASANPRVSELAGRFCRISEPGRSALALLYLDHFSPQEIAQILQLTMEEFADAVDSARAHLRGMEEAQKAAAPMEPREP